jgi:hypothetical protein
MKGGALFIGAGVFELNSLSFVNNTFVSGDGRGMDVYHMNADQVHQSYDDTNVMFGFIILLFVII